MMTEPGAGLLGRLAFHSGFISDFDKRFTWTKKNYFSLIKKSELSKTLICTSNNIDTIICIAKH